MNAGVRLSKGMYRLVIAHYLFSAFCFLLLSFLLWGSYQDFWGHYFSPKLLALTHLACLGWGTTVIFGAAYQLMPVLFETDIRDEKVPIVGFISFIIGLFFLITSFWVFDSGLFMQIGGSLVLLAILLFCWVLIRTANASKKRKAVYLDFIISSCFWLAATGIVGLILVFNFQYPFLPKDHLMFLRIHAHMGLGGWFLLLIIGVSSKLIPMFVVSREQQEKWLINSYYLINIALLLFIVDVYLAGITCRTYVVIFIFFIGVIYYLAYLWRCFTSRIKKKIDLPISNAVVSFFMLCLGIICMPLIIFFYHRGDQLSIRISVIYGSFLFLGWISSIILGLAYKTFPFIIWARKYQSLVGKTQTPLPGNLYSLFLFRLQTVCFLGFSLLFYPAILLESKSCMIMSLACLNITALTYLFNLLIILLHKVKDYKNG